MSAREQRRGTRIQPFVAACRVNDGARWFGGYLTDLSAEGARVMCSAEPPGPEARVLIEARLGRRASRSPLPATVKWSRVDGAQGPMFGVTFEGLDEAGRQALLAVVQEFERRAAELS
ncbi:MAG TPA: PilZ domain-containing protein [Vicinamibacteria bacterium]|nr:PilZ domain-containing protein [Vicinamibacteria bacterium]